MKDKLLITFQPRFLMNFRFYTLIFSKIIYMSKNLKKNLETAKDWLLAVGFILIAIGAWLVAPKPWEIRETLAQPFHLGATFIAIVSLLKALRITDDKMFFAAMTVFIITKVITQISHSQHLDVNAWGLKAIPKLDGETITEEFLDDIQDRLNEKFEKLTKLRKITNFRSKSGIYKPLQSN